MKICYVSFEYPPQFGGGIGTYIGNISRNLAEYGHEVHVVTFNPGGLLEQETISAVHIHRITMDGPQMEIINNVGSPNLSTLLYWSHYSEKVYRKLQELVRAHSFDCIEFCDYRGEGYFSMLAKRTRGEFAEIPLVIRMHTPLFILNRYNNAVNDPGMQQLVNFENFAMLLADQIVSPAQVLADLTAQELGLTESIPILPHPIDLELLPFRVPEGESETLLYVGRLENRKGVVDLVRAMVEFLPKQPQARLKCIGGDTQTGPQNGSMKAYLLSLIPDHLKKRIEFIDRLPREQVLQEYGKARFCVFPSLFENFPNVCLEAMASGVPVVVSNFSGMAEMIEDGKSGLIFKAQDIGELVEKIEALYSLSLPERNAMGLEARRRVETAYSAQAINDLQSHYFQQISKRAVTNVAGAYQKGLVSVIIPCYNHGVYLHETIDSVFANTYQNVEIIVVNDGSTDPATLDVLSHLNRTNVRVVHQANAGLSAARNTGVAHARGEYILPLDADDLIAPVFLEKTVAELESDSSVGFVYTYVQFFGAADGVWQTPEFDPNLLLVSNLCVATSLYRHDAFDQIGGYKTDMVYGFEDWDFWIYMVEKGWRGKCVREPLFLYRKHQESMLSNSQRHRPFLIEKLVEHHLESYQRSLSYVVVEKDRQFFDEHMSNYLNSQKLNGVTNSKAWKVILAYRKAKDRLRRLLGGQR